MSLAPFFSLLIWGGLTSLVAAFCYSLVLRRKMLLRAVVERFSGRQPQGPEVPAADQITLRREARAPWWRYLLPTDGREVGMAAFTAEMRRIGLVLTLTITTLMMIVLNTFLSINILTGAAAGLLLSGVAWYIWMRARAAKRLLQIEESVPEALDMIVRSLRVGMPVGTALQTVGRELTGPLAEEFSETSMRISYGQQPVRALREMADRCKNQSLRFLAAAVALQSATGGNLAEVLERLCAIARGRQQLQRKVRSITAEAKWSGRFLSFFPIAATMILLSINPQYFDEISDKSFFIPMLCVVAFLLVMNMLFMRWLVKIE